jgi:hypothetical protein
VVVLRSTFANSSSFARLCLLKNKTPPLPLHLGRKAADHVAQHGHQIHHHWQSLSLPLSIRRRRRNHEAKKHRPSDNSDSSSSSSSSARCSIVGSSGTTTTTTGNVVVVGPCRKNGLDCTFIDTTTNLFHHLLVVCRTRSHIVWTISANNDVQYNYYNYYYEYASRCPAPRRHSRHGQRLGTSHLRTRRARHF